MLSQSIKSRISNSIIHTILIASSAIMLFPFLWMISSAFMSNAEITAVPIKWIPSRLRWENFSEMFERINMARYFLNSCIFAGVSTFSVVMSSSLAGFIFAKYDFFAKNVIFMLVLSVMMVPFALLLVPLYVVMSRLHWVNTFAGLIVPNSVMAFGIFLMRQFISGMPNDLIYSMRIDGSSEIGIWTRLILPNMKAALSSLSVFAFMFTWDMFLWPLVITSSDKVQPLTVGLAMFNEEWWSQYNLVMAGSLIAVMPILIIFFFAQKQFIEGITLSGLKT